MAVRRLSVMTGARYIRTLQTFFPWARGLKFDAYDLATRHLGWRIEPEFTVLRTLAPCREVVDVGGNWGQSIEALKLCAKPRRIVSFEPNPELSARLARRYAADSQVVVASTALSSERGEATLFVPVYRGFVFDGLASLDREEAAGWLNQARMARFDPGRLEIREHRVQLMPMDDYGLSPDVLKIDVQGHESAVIEGALETIRSSSPVVIVEGPGERAVELLASAGLSAFTLADGWLRPGRMRTINTMFLSAATAAVLARSAETTRR